ncbi:hypothetical protein SADUNF_Sadunf08G0104200 [Salix dunnii]|uniref:Uncharacterized protein n=1 Tax=Salix dunnii TaxID=1413687 RepID=A0A835MXU1_9ROSI|nr:hypothetical protein SADUNF_Sadunf08G0104200 [Salix dunnii]
MGYIMVCNNDTMFLHVKYEANSSFFSENKTCICICITRNLWKGRLPIVDILALGSTKAGALCSHFFRSVTEERRGARTSVWRAHLG